ncbi:MAG: hypothetical protein E7591_05105 [Ruminococcaceae bacterium]|nr:hypothetical protein [Oscillospiraceae bacterium]
MKREFNLLDVLELLKKRWWILLLSGVIAALIAIAYSETTYVPKYTTSLDILVKTTSNDSMNDAVQAATLVQKKFDTCKNLLGKRKFMKNVSEIYEERYPKEWERQSYSSEWLKNSVKFTVEDENSYIFTISVTTKNPDDSYRIGEIIHEIAPDYIDYYEDNCSIEVCEDPIRTSEPSNSNNMTRNVIMGILIGVILSFLVVFIIDITDVRIKHESDIVDNYPLPLLGSIPNFDSVASKKKGYGYGYGKKE